MRKLFFLKLILALLFITTAFNSLLAQDTEIGSHILTVSIPEVAILDVESTEASTSITIGPTAPTEAGEALDFSTVTNNALWLNYSSIKNTSTGDAARTISVVATGTMPTGMTLSLTVADPAGSGGGALGSVIGGGSAFTLGGGTQNIIQSIGSCYTGNLANNGHQLTYGLAMDNSDYAALDAVDTDITVTYTLSDN